MTEEENLNCEGKIINKKEGWTWLYQASKWHYFREQNSLCRKWAIFNHPKEGYEIGNNDSDSNCKTCMKIIAKESEIEN